MALKTMVRRVKDDFEALMMCNAFEECDGVPVSVVFELSPGGIRHWHVFGRVDESRFADADGAFETLMARK